MVLMTDVELAEIRDFLRSEVPFNDLPTSAIDSLPGKLKVQYFRRDSTILRAGADNDSLFIVRSGAVELTDSSGEFMDRVDVGRSFGSHSLLSGQPSGYSATALEDTLALVMPGVVFHELTGAHPSFAEFFDLQRASRMRGAVATLHMSAMGGAILKTRVSSIVSRPAVTAPPTATIREAATIMTDSKVSSLLIVEDNDVVGIVTDRDLRSRALAIGMDPGHPVKSIMTKNPVTASAESLAFEVLMEMLARNIHHLPVVRDGEPAGVITTTDLMRLEQANPVFLVGDIVKQKDVAGVAAVTQRLASVVETLVSQDASADDIGRVVTAVGDAVERRLIGLAEEKLGPPPVPFCWVSLGSRARQEQALAADQDNAMILSDDATAEHAAYFEALAAEVTSSLVECGYPLCPGDIMASNPRWRVTLSQWRREFSTWITEPVPDAILRASIFFDMRPIYGEVKLFRDLQRHVLSLTPESRLFLAHLAKRAGENEPPIGFFRGFVLQKAGDHKDTLDIKRGGIGSVVEMARVLALSIGSREVNTRARITAAVAAGAMSAERGEDLMDALEFISYVRLRHQAAKVRTGQEPNNFVSPSDLSTFERRNLREAFSIVRSAQTSLAQRYPSSYIS
jgi:CBS domain-containing protein